MAPKKAQPRQKAATHPESPTPDDFHDYHQWVQEAAQYHPDLTSSKIQADWNELDRDHSVVFARVVRAFQAADHVRILAENELREAASIASLLKQDGIRQSFRVVIRLAEDSRGAVVRALKARQNAIKALLLRLGAMDAALTTRPLGQFRSVLQAHQQRLIQLIEAAEEEIDTWMNQGQSFFDDDFEWTESNLGAFVAFARGIENGRVQDEPSSQPEAGPSRSPSKRKRHSENEESGPKALRGSRDANVVHSRSAQPGAAPSQDVPSGSRASRHNLDQVSGDDPAEQHDAAPGLQHPLQESTGDRQSTPDRRSFVSAYTPPQSPSEPQHATPQPPSLPTIGVAYPWTQRLQRDLSQSPHSSFMSWCRRQFVTANYRTLEECEPLAKAVYAFSRRVLDDHDWENESDMPPVPMKSDDFYDFELGTGHGRMWGNLRRLFNIKQNAPLSFRKYYYRNLAADDLYVRAADANARQIIELVQEKGLSHDWEAENDLFTNAPSVATTNRFPLVGMNGHWNIRAEMGSGGNGRALLYSKYDSAGNVVQRVISKESFVGYRWNSRSLWSGPVASRIPLEAGLHRLLPRNPHIIEYLGFHVNKQLRMIRHYTAFAELGDLHSLFENHARIRNAIDENGNALQPPPIPVAAIIYMFQAMAVGACLMTYGAVPDDQGRWPGDRTPTPAYNIIHRDIKPQNYFISSSKSSVMWPQLPIAALGDFGNAFDAADTSVVHDSHEWGTTNWMAPEQIPNVSTTCGVTPLTNVYQIGLAILQLMHLERPKLQAKYDTQGQDPVFPGYSPNANLYPQDLIDIAEDCVQLLPPDRPTPVDLYHRIRNLASSYPDEAHKDVPWQLQTVPPNQLVRTVVDAWAV